MMPRNQQPIAEVDHGEPTEYSISPLLCLCFLQSNLFLAFVTDHLDAPWYLGCHLGICAITLAWGAGWAHAVIADGHAGTRYALVVQLVTWMAIGGPFGTLVATALYVPKGEPLDAAKIAKVRCPELPRYEVLCTSLLDHRLRLHGACAVRPLLDVMIEGTRLEKLDALSVISRRFAPAFAMALRRALQDTDNSVRVLAATVLAQQHGIFAKRIGSLQARAKEHPSDPEIRRGLGQASLDYAESGLLEAAQACTLACEARANLARAADDKQRDGEMQPSIAKGIPCQPKPMSA